MQEAVKYGWLCGWAGAAHAARLRRVRQVWGWLLLPALVACCTLARGPG